MIITRRFFLGMVACLPVAWQVTLGIVPRKVQVVWYGQGFYEARYTALWVAQTKAGQMITVVDDDYWDHPYIHKYLAQEPYASMRAYKRSETIAPWERT